MAAIRRIWACAPSSGDATRAALLTPREDILLERAEPDGSFSCQEGPFRRYRRVVAEEGGQFVETTDYELAIPWWAWLFALPVAAVVKRPPQDRSGKSPWWAPPDRLDARAATVVGLVAAASLIYGYVNTLFTQTVTFAADEFGTSDTAQGVAGAVVRCGIVVSIALVFIADRKGRRRMLVLASVLAPVLCAFGAVAPSFAWLTVTQTLGRPVGIALLLLVGIVAAEEMPRNSRAYAISVVALAGGLGAGLCLIALPLADIGVRSWRLVYVVPLIFLPIAWDLHRRLPETRRFEAPHAVAPTFHRRRFALLASTAFLVNLLVAPASFFNNRYLKDVRGFPAWKISVFSLCTNTPGGIGVVAGGKLADVHGRRIVGAVAVAGGALFTVAMFTVSGWPMWMASMAGAIVGGAGVPALGVYGAELFPTGNRGKASGLISVLSLVGSSAGLLLAGWLLDQAVGYNVVMGALAVAPLIVAVMVIVLYPETAHHELEDMNPEDRVAASSADEAHDVEHEVGGAAVVVQRQPTRAAEPDEHEIGHVVAGHEVEVRGERSGAAGRPDGGEPRR
jgi:MFS family permease